MKLADAPFVISKQYAAMLRHKLEVFRRETRTRKATQLVFVTSYGAAEGAHASEVVDNVVTMDDLLR